MYILGLSCFYHDSAACLIKDGQLVAAAVEERFSRRKHDFSFPERAIAYCLDEAGIEMAAVDQVVFYEKPILKFDRILSQHLAAWPRSFLPFYLALPSWFNEKLRLRRILKKRLGYRKSVLYVPHHLSHAASAFFVSPFRDAAVLTLDGVGEWQTSTLSIGRDRQIEQIAEINFPHSLGLLYSMLTAYLGFKVNNDEYKVMGLAAYGRPRYLERLRRLVDVKPDGSFALCLEYFSFLHAMRMYSPRFVKEFGPPREPESAITEYHQDLAASLQALTEEIVFKICAHLHRLTGSDRLCFAGGVALNSVLNGKLLKYTPFKEIYIQPEAGDGGGALGAAFYAYHQVFEQPRSFVMDHAFWGPQYSRDQMKKFLDERQIVYKEYADDQVLLDDIAQFIKNNFVIGWVQGRMEWGPRALGARSILSNPTNPKMQEILNLKVKHREPFRPFAPAVLADQVSEYFVPDDPLPLPVDFMLMVYPVKEAKQKLIPAVTHVDGSGRLQTVRRSHNAYYYDLIEKFGKLTGVPILINTSFNIRGEPIVCTPADAYRCMMGTGIDWLVMGKFLIKRADNPRDIWDSEKYAAL
ncbi:hypothetical protein A2671_00165 [Candidatus Kaiserbacteria bacterium RIFCSPHIGHO2_01_FULL_49_13]|uniref:Carbamoyltransferase n=1 Tax=Candidatus Kaiserbacteria bacterium RIFCSPHIGHO2_01_FULL_49_13 TaxID=1798477 RepID=A0A1F6CDX1_9BACT|nr:MAG: hypothetical protein A2671_00165 [Candidatus Kaiserbacteria bacterium RIFCSPHIGHO2_01_FULL_49_13]